MREELKPTLDKYRNALDYLSKQGKPIVIWNEDAGPDGFQEAVLLGRTFGNNGKDIGVIRIPADYLPQLYIFCQLM